MGSFLVATWTLCNGLSLVKSEPYFAINAELIFDLIKQELKMLEPFQPNGLPMNYFNMGDGSEIKRALNIEF